LAVVLLILVGILYVSFRQRQRIATLRYNEELQKTSREIELKALETRMAAVYKERNRIASDLHDDIGAALSSIHIYGKAAEKQFASNPVESQHLLDRINEGSKGMMERMSDIVWSINPKNDNVESLVFRMKSHASEVLNPLNIRVDYSVDASSEEIQPSLEARRSIYLIFKEAVNNISKYSEAKTVNVRLTAIEGNFMLDIEDDGKGFNVVEAQHGNGLGSMSERAQGIGGVFHISSHHGRGTHLQLKVPIANISDRNNTGNAVHL
jgi:signal transduction histidine kinase